MSILQFVPTLELLFFNLLSIDRCCDKKYPGWATAAILFTFSAVAFAFSYTFAEELSFLGDGTLSLYGFVYLIPMRLIYKEKLSYLIIIICSCWVYTLGILSLSLQFADVAASGSIFVTIIAENLLFFVTWFPFYRRIVSKYVFVMENLQSFDKSWYKYIALNNGLSFLMLESLNRVFRREGGSWAKIFTLLLILAAIYVSFFILYMIVLDAIKKRKLEGLARQDSLTGIGNRAALWEDLQFLIEENQAFSVLFMDLDHFKEINDQYGHVVGDQYLKHFSEMISRLLPKYGRMYRFGGDEFVAIYPGAVPDEVIQRLRECQGWEEGAPCPFNQVSVGVHFCRPPHQDVEQILQQVDRLMYRQKLSKEEEAARADNHLRGDCAADCCPKGSKKHVGPDGGRRRWP